MFFKRYLILITIIGFVSAQTVPVQAFGIAEVTALIVFSGKVYSAASTAVSVTTSVVSAETAKRTAQESEKTIEDFIEVIAERVAEADRKAHYASTEAETKQAMEQAASLRALQLKYINYLSTVKENKAFTYKDILVSEAKDQGVGYVSGQVQGYILNNEAREAALSIGQALYESGGNIIGGRTAAEVTEADREFMSELQRRPSSAIQVAISKAEWDKFVNITAKQEFIDYLTGASERFADLPLSIQERYQRQMFLLSPTEISEINNIMQQARATGDYHQALKVITEKHPYYKNTFIDLAKKTFGSDQEWIQQVEEGLKEKIEEQDRVVSEAAEEPLPVSTPERPAESPQTAQPEPVSRPSEDCRREARSYEEWKAIEAEKSEGLAALKIYQSCMNNRWKPVWQEYADMVKQVHAHTEKDGPVCGWTAQKNNPLCTENLRALQSVVREALEECRLLIPPQYIVQGYYGEEQLAWHDANTDLDEFIERKENYLNNKVIPFVREMAPYCE